MKKSLNNNEEQLQNYFSTKNIKKSIMKDKTSLSDLYHKSVKQALIYKYISNEEIEEQEKEEVEEENYITIDFIEYLSSFNISIQEAEDIIN